MIVLQHGIYDKTNLQMMVEAIFSDLIKRASEHKNKVTTGFTARFNVRNLVYYKE